MGKDDFKQQIIADDGSLVQDVVQVLIDGQVDGRVRISDTVDQRDAYHELTNYLARTVAKLEARIYRVTAGIAESPADPYKFLYAYDMADAGIFLGRDDASEALLQAVLKDRMTVLHAKSGAGKTSLVNAGLSPRLVKAGRLPIYARAWEEPSLAIKRALAPASFGPWPELLRSLSLQEFLGLACSHLGPGTKEIVVILDQFEDFYIFWPESEGRRRFNDELSDCYNDFNLPVRFVISLRKDYYSDLSELQERIPKIFHNQNRIEPMSREEAYTAITGPTEKLRCPAAYEPALVDKMLDDLSRHGMELPHLQIICTELYQSLPKYENIIRLNHYNKLGQIEGILAHYMRVIMERIPGGNEILARRILTALVSSNSEKRRMRYAGLLKTLDVTEQELDAVLTYLMNARLLLRYDDIGQRIYELGHEYIIKEVKRWINPEAIALKQASELLGRELATWQSYGNSIPKDRLLVILKQPECLKEFGSETCELLAKSLIASNASTEELASIPQDVIFNIITEGLPKNISQVDRREYLKLIGKGIGSEEVAQLGYESDIDRWYAARKLGVLQHPVAIIPLVLALEDNCRHVRIEAAAALLKIGGSNAMVFVEQVIRDENIVD